MTNKKGVSPVAAGIVGAVVGAAVGATAVVVSDEKNRKDIKNKLNEFKEGGSKAYSGVKKNIGELSSQAEEKVQDTRKNLKNKL